jgi:hypothetical protein
VRAQEFRDRGDIMAVLQTPLNIPDDVFARLVTGEYVRDEGVVRDFAGRLVKLLDDASPGATSKEPPGRLSRRR